MAIIKSDKSWFKTGDVLMSAKLPRFVVIFLLFTPNLARADKVVLVAGGGSGGDGGLATAAKLVNPFGVGFDRAGNTYIVEMEGGERVRMIDRKGIITTIAGTGEKGDSGEGGPATKAKINGCHHLLVLPNGDILLAQAFNNKVSRIDRRTGIIKTIAGTGVSGYSGDGGPATRAKFGGIYCLALSPKNDRLYLCDLDNRRIRAVDMKTGVVTTIAGNGRKGVPEDGQTATESPLVDPRAIAVDKRGSLYILERSGNALRIVDSSGKIRTLIRPKPKPSSPLDNLNGPKHLCVDRDANVLIADTENNRIVKFIRRTGKLVIIAGTGKEGAGGAGGSAKEIELNRPHGVFARTDGVIYISDSENGRVLRIEP